MAELTPREIMAELDKHIIGQSSAKRSVAIALRNRWRRMQLDEDMRAEISPKNILMIGPTGVGKTEIARRLAKLVNAPFVKVEATKFTEVGYVGRDVESIIRDLAEVAFKNVREEAVRGVEAQAKAAAEEKILDILLPKTSKTEWDADAPETEESAGRKMFREKLRAGELNDREIEVEVNLSPMGMQIMAPPGMEEMTDQLQGMFQSMSSGRKKSRKLPIHAARRALEEDAASRMVNEDELKFKALEQVEQNGIVFLDEIDKVAKRSEHGGDVSREGVQRDLLPLVEGCTVSTKYGMVRTDYILFIASGAFHLSKPSDLIPELQGRLPIRVELSALTVEDFVRILTEPDASLTEQYTELLKTEGCHLEFTIDGIARIAEIAWEVNENTENIGARRLHTVVERLLEDVSYQAEDPQFAQVVINAEYVNSKLGDVIRNYDLSRYIL